MLILAILLSFQTLTTIGKQAGNDPVDGGDWQCFRETTASNALKCRIPLDRWRSIQRQFVQRSLFRSQTVLEPYFFDFTTNPIDVRFANDADSELMPPTAVFFNNEPENLRFIYDALVPKIKHLLGSSASSSSNAGSMGFSGSINGNVAAPNGHVPQSLPHYVHVINNVYGGLSVSNQTFDPHKTVVATSTTTESIVLTKKPITLNPNLATEAAIEDFINYLLHNNFSSSSQNTGPSSNTLPVSIQSIDVGGNGGVDGDSSSGSDVPLGIFANINNSLEQGQIAFPLNIGATGGTGNDGNYYASSGNGLAVINIELGTNGPSNWQTKNNGSVLNLHPVHVIDKNTSSNGTNQEKEGHQEHQQQEQNKKKTILSLLIQKKIKENQQFIDLIDQIVKIKGN